MAACIAECFAGCIFLPADKSKLGYGTPNTLCGSVIIQFTNTAAPAPCSPR